ncbi:glycosyltransferase [Candidatus Methanoperedens nitroreducens]|uniref:Glycosyltransferase n=1 Tax=Candidatus Methanoperedens nitratireducens TaxID=1392998 RepID=A0A062UUT2_9EURY|nr:glycosyltransferase family 4 protein [Candidatus Methanoperedens nitroreducens]KCZ70786.1 glycosyltransferase [Candidatus Methanoperedens nitroreducens]MDJ1420641.1 glycosyltransferase family 4 protein [Candidatus Methanoperedens sp.]
MKVCYISSFYPPLVFGGAEIYVQRISEKLVQQDHEVVVVTTNSKISVKPVIEKRNGVKIYRIHPINIYSIYNTLSKPDIIKPIWYMIDLLNIHSYIIIKNILMKEKPDIVHVHNFKGFSFAFDAVKSHNLPLMFTMHDYFLECIKENLFRSCYTICQSPPLLCRSYIELQRYLKDNKPDIVTAPCQFVIDKLKNDGFFEKTRTTKLPLGIELGNNKKIEKEYEIIDILFAGRLNIYKGVHILINAFRQIKYKNIHLHIVGEGKEMEELKKIAEHNPDITFYGFVSENMLIELYKKANIAVVPSIWYETFGIVIIESFKFSTPVIASNIGGFPELVENGYNGFLFEAGNTDELKKILENLIENPQELKRLNDNAFESVKKYSMEEHTKKLMRLYEELLKQKSKGVQ